jgi:hypothetical protein
MVAALKSAATDSTPGRQHPLPQRICSAGGHLLCVAADKSATAIKSFLVPAGRAPPFFQKRPSFPFYAIEAHKLLSITAARMCR